MPLKHILPVELGLTLPPGLLPLSPSGLATSATAPAKWGVAVAGRGAKDVLA
jgi:hypothetical protein